MISTKIILRLSIIFQFLLRLYLTFPLSSQIVKATGLVVEAAWAGAAYNLMLFMLASHVTLSLSLSLLHGHALFPTHLNNSLIVVKVIGSCWYLLAIERQEQCWKDVCNLQRPTCQHVFFKCSSVNVSGRAVWFESSNITTLCGPDGGFYQFGIYADALTFGVTSTNFFNKYSYCLWWGLRNLR